MYTFSFTLQRQKERERSVWNCSYSKVQFHACPIRHTDVRFCSLLLFPCIQDIGHSSQNNRCVHRAFLPFPSIFVCPMRNLVILTKFLSSFLLPRWFYFIRSFVSHIVENHDSPVVNNQFMFMYIILVYVCMRFLQAEHENFLLLNALNLTGLQNVATTNIWHMLHPLIFGHFFPSIYVCFS